MTRGAVPCVVVGGTSSGVGKTSIAVGLMSALRWGCPPALTRCDLPVGTPWWGLPLPETHRFA